MPRRKQRYPTKKKSSVVYRGYVPKRYGSKRKKSAPVIRGINYVRQRLTSVLEVKPAPGATKTNVTLFWQQTSDGVANPPAIVNNTNLSYNMATRFK